MKRILFAVALTFTAIASQGALVKWSATNMYDGKGTDTANKIAVGTVAYLFDANAVSQASLYTLFCANTKLDLATAGGYVGDAVATAGAIPATTSDVSTLTAGGAYSIYFAIVKNDMLYLSNVKSGTMGASATVATSAAIGSQNKDSLNTFSGLGATTGGVAGRWNTASVPEPTSGLMMLIGVGLMALKRKRA